MKSKLSLKSTLFSIESRVDRLRQNLKKGIIGMDKALQRYCKQQKKLEAGDNKENVGGNFMRTK